MGGHYSADFAKNHAEKSVTDKDYGGCQPPTDEARLSLFFKAEKIKKKLDFQPGLRRSHQPDPISADNMARTRAASFIFLILLFIYNLIR